MSELYFYSPFQIKNQMKPFVANIATYIIDNELSFEDLTIVLPSQRMTSYMQRALFEAVGKPILLLLIYPMNVFGKKYSKRFKMVMPLSMHLILNTL